MAAGWFVATLVVAGLVCVGTATLAWRQGPGRGTRSYVAMMASVVFWIAVILLSVGAGRYRVALFFQELTIFASGVTALTWFVFVLEYTGNERYLTRPTVAVLAAEPLVVLAATLTNGSHGLMYSDDRPAAVATGVEFDLAAGFWLHAAFAYVLLASAVALLAGMAYRRQDLYRSQVAALVVAVAAPWVANVVSLVEIVATDVTAAGFAVSGVALFYAVYRFEFLDLTPVARSAVVDDVEDGVVVLDREDRLTDVNPAAREMLALSDDVVGEHAREALSAYPAVWERLADVSGTTEEVELDTGSDRRTYRFRASPLTDDRGREVGRVVVVHDVTEQKRRQEELERQNQQLEQFASVVSHDLRNPLAVAQSYLQVARGSDDPSDSHDAIEESLDRMEAMIEDVLTLAREGQTVTETESVDLGLLAREAWGNVETGEATLTVESGAERQIQADRDRLLHVFENLFRNAVEHSPPEWAGEVRVGPIGSDAEPGLVEESDRRGFFVADDGPGIPPDHREEVLDEGFTTSQDGTGLGLAIVQSIVESHGWELSVAESWAGGARFEVTGVSMAADGTGAESAPAVRSSS